MSDNNDDYSFEPTISSNLHSLFQNVDTSECPSLMYTAPRQPNASTANSGPSASQSLIHPTSKQSKSLTSESKNDSSTICAQVVQVWKLFDGKYTATGKCGVAIIGPTIKKSYEIILYKTKADIIARSKICPCFKYFLKKDNFAAFYDTSKNNWLIKFNNHEQCLSISNNIEKYCGKIITEGEDIQQPQSNNSSCCSKERESKPDVLSRIAKIGQPIVPSVSSNVEESILETSQSLVKSRKSSTSSERLKSHSDKSTSTTICTMIKNEVVHNLEVAIKTPSILSDNTRSVPDKTTSASMGFEETTGSVSNTYPMPTSPPSLYSSETRSQNSQIEKSLEQISEKLDSIMSLVDCNASNSVCSCETLKSKLKVAELRIENLSKDLTTVHEENRILRQQIANSKQNVESSIQSIAKISELESEINSQNHTNGALSNVIAMQKSEIQELKEKFFCRCHTEDTTKNGLVCDIKVRSANFTALLKEEMNAMYAKILEGFNKSRVDTSELDNIIAHNIKVTTVNIIQHFQFIFQEPK